MQWMNYHQDIINDICYALFKWKTLKEWCNNDDSLVCNEKMEKIYDFYAIFQTFQNQ